LIVIDASLALAWLFNDERATEADEIFVAAVSEGMVVPPLFWLETANALRTRLRRGAISMAFRDGALGRLRALGVLTASETDTIDLALDRTVTLSDRYDLTIYDAVYLELALRLRAPLRTFDAALARAAVAAGVA
jgi:predicted nucleic acid-binding protein